MPKGYHPLHLIILPQIICASPHARETTRFVLEICWFWTANLLTCIIYKSKRSKETLWLLVGFGVVSRPCPLTLLGVPSKVDGPQEWIVR